MVSVSFVMIPASRASFSSPTHHTTIRCSSFDGDISRSGSPRMSLITSLLRRSKPRNASSPDTRVHLVIDLDASARQASTALRHPGHSLRRFLSSGASALSDLHTLVAFDGQGRIVLSCRRSSLDFAANLLLLSFLVFFAARFLGGLGLGSWLRGGWEVVRRRDRSLGGREVVVGRRPKQWRGFRVLGSPLADVRRDGAGRAGVSDAGPRRRALSQEALPAWWPEAAPPPVVRVEKEEFRREANRLVQAIMDNRMSGKDLTEDEIIQIRRTCKNSGVRISIDNANARDSFYRATVDFVLKVCSNMSWHPNLAQIDGEEVRKFIAGFADNIGLENIRAAKIVCAAVAARTRSWFLQAWALEMQGKRSEALDELLKICRVHETFPPEEFSPEMEMVAQGLGKHLTIEQRKHLLTLFEQACGSESQSSGAEALGLVTSK